jgi:predicted enzyme related to lactoylglutathione lyase
MKILDVAYICYAVKSLKVSRPFYEGAFNLKSTKEWLGPDGDTGFVEYDVGPTTLALGAGSEAFKPGGGTNVTASLEVEDFDAAVKHLRDFGAKFTAEPYDTPVCRMVIIMDPDDNPIMIHQRK